MKIEKWGNRVLVCMSAILLIFLSAMSILFSQRCGVEEAGEIINGTPIYQIRDNLAWHLLGIVCIAVIFLILCRLESAIGDRGLLIWQLLIALVSGVWAFCILQGGVRTPVGDQAQVYSAASLFNQGNYINMSKGGYLDMYPQQLGLVAYIQLVFRIFGNGNFQAVQLLNCFWIMGIVFCMCRCMNKLTNHTSIKMLGSLLTLFFLPVFLLCSWVYGDIPCLFFSFLALLLYLHFIENHSGRYLVAMTATMCLSLLFRKNSLIIMLAFALALLFHWWRKRKNIIILALCLILLTPLAGVRIVERHYERVSGYTIDGGLPSVMWIAMGVTEGASKPGWFNNFSVPIYYETGYDRGRSSEAARQAIRERMELFASDPLYAISFYKRKICTQWNDPYYNTNLIIHVDGETPAGPTRFLLRQENGSVFQGLSAYQVLIYLGALLYCVLQAVGKNVEQNVILIVFVGGLLFSVLWEANSRYVLPYALMLVLISAEGWGQVLLRLKEVVKLRISKRKF